MDAPELSAFLEDLGRAELFHKVEGATDSFKRKYRREIIVFLSMLHHVELFGAWSLEAIHLTLKPNKMLSSKRPSQQSV